MSEKYETAQKLVKLGDLRKVRFCEIKDIMQFSLRYYNKQIFLNFFKLNSKFEYVRTERKNYISWYV